MRNLESDLRAGGKSLFFEAPKGVVQEQLANILSHSMDCRKDLFLKLYDQMLRAPDRRSFDITPDFLAGRWEVQQDVVGISGGSLVDYRADGTFAGYQTAFVGGIGQKQAVTGRWDITKLSQDTFQLKLQFYPQQTAWTGTFKIIDADHIHNIDANYVAIRIK
jgi:hypothetical protein